MNNLHFFLEEENYPFQVKPFRASSIFFPINYHNETIQYIKERGGKIIQRLDGIYYPEKHGNEFEKLNAPIKKTYLEYADHVIFQSEYSRAQCFEFLGKLDDAKYSIITNGVNKSVFAPGQKRRLSTPIRLITTGVFRNVDMVEPIIMALDSLRKKHYVELHLVGPITNKSLEIYLDRSYVKNYSTNGGSEIAEVLKTADLFIYSHLNPPCPNSVIEAISCGLPVIGFNSGAMSELCFFSKDLLAPLPDKVFHSYNDFDFRGLAENILVAIENFNEIKQRALDYSYLYSLESCGEAYFEIFDRMTLSLSLAKTWQADISYFLNGGFRKIRSFWKEMSK